MRALVGRATVNPYLRIALRGWMMVTLVAMNTVQLAHGHDAAAALGGFCISALWWSNSSKDRENVRGAGVVYGIGAALGTLTGAMVARWLGSLY